ncbi:capsule biosynthesis protein [Parvibaculum sp.]|uniref:capsule biosynthesis protein n=1 Tax=Parvibaculum sp. TaxID=2024848 RepID=UPI00391BDB2C
MKRTFLFLQGNSSHFFLALGKALDEKGYGVSRINMSGGDWYFWGDWNAIDYKDAPERFGEFVRAHVTRNGVTDVILHNDCRPGHRLAIETIRDLGCRIWVFEEGYMRPHWLTLEEGGINGYSPLMNGTSFRLESANDNRAEEAGFVALPPGMKRRVMYDFQWQIWNYLLWFRYPRFRTHRPFPIWAEYATWLRRLVVLPFRKRHARRIIDRLAEGNEKFFLFPLQLDTDSQVRVHSPFSGMCEALDEVICNFAAHAPQDARLIVKAHPLDNGWINFRRRTLRMAQRHGVAGRVEYIDGGDLNLLVRLAAGTVILNSTVGLTALEGGCPVICLGKAIFDLPGLTFQGDLSAFWRAPERPDGDIFSGFLRHLRRESLINGDYYTDLGMGLAVENAIARFETSCREAGRGSASIDHPLMGAEIGVETSSARSEACAWQDGVREARTGLSPHP